MQCFCNVFLFTYLKVNIPFFSPFYEIWYAIYKFDFLSLSLIDVDENKIDTYLYGLNKKVTQIRQKNFTGKFTLLLNQSCPDLLDKLLEWRFILQAKTDLFRRKHIVIYSVTVYLICNMLCNKCPRVAIYFTYGMSLKPFVKSVSGWIARRLSDQKIVDWKLRSGGSPKFSNIATFY